MTELPAQNADGFVTLSDFFGHQHESIKTGLKTAQIPHQIEFYQNVEQTWKDGAFRVYVPAEHIEPARKICMAIEGAVVF